MKRLCIALIVVLVFASFASASDRGRVSLKLSFTGTTAKCKIEVTEAGAAIDVTMYLYEGSSLVCSWSKSGTDYVSLNKSRTCVSGQTYTLEADVTVNGVPISVTPVTKTCP
ncbi:MAG: hypothetical protein K5981_09220 [Clostridia bacterium]|nr:hypothetical protein [Clostridia bacterium]